MRWLIFGRDDDLGSLDDWTPARAARAAEATARYLLGSCGPVQVQDAASVRRAQFWAEVEQKPQRGRVLPLRRSR